MTWFMPSWSRPHKFAALARAPGGWPPEVIVQVNEDDPKLDDYRAALRDRPWVLDIIPAGSRCSDAHRITYERYPFEASYGFLMDDLWPLTLNWWALLDQAAGKTYIAIPQGPGYPRTIRGAFVMGGDLVRAMGSVVPAPVHHMCEDVIWDDIARECALMRPVAKAIVDHRTWVMNTAANDATYERGREFWKQDEVILQDWLQSSQRSELLERVRAMLRAKEERDAKLSA